MQQGQGHITNWEFVPKGTLQSAEKRSEKVPYGYRFGFQGQEKDDEVYGATGTSYNYTYRMHDARVGRFLSIDPLASKYAYNSPYAFSENRVIDAVELEGLESQIISRLAMGDGSTTVLRVQNWKDIKGATGEHGPLGKGTEYQDYHVGSDTPDASYEPTLGESISTWWNSFTIGDKTGGNRGDVEYTDQKPGQVMSPDALGGTKGTSPQVSTDKSGEGESNATENHPSLWDRYVGQDFDELQQGDTFYFKKDDPMGGTYPMPGRKDSSNENGYYIPKLPDSKEATDYVKVKPSSLPR